MTVHMRTVWVSTKPKRNRKVVVRFTEEEFKRLKTAVDVSAFPSISSYVRFVLLSSLGGVTNGGTKTQSTRQG